ncbi:hypothetical protein J6590_012246 [Homalodisca vitripennis]|nr:hypothetical protein J6590_012246 [Homalodisca vitripennis]
MLREEVRLNSPMRCGKEQSDLKALIFSGMRKMEVKIDFGQKQTRINSNGNIFKVHFCFIRSQPISETPAAAFLSPGSKKSNSNVYRKLRYLPTPFPDKTSTSIFPSI